MFTSLLSSWTIFFGLSLIMIGNGMQQVLLALRATEAGYTNLMAGIMLGGYFLGLFLGSIFVPRLLGNVGHIRIFGALAAVASAAVLVHVMYEDPILWALLRVASGVAYAGMYIIVESWLNDKATNETRGQILSIYMIITMASLGAGQMLTGLDDGQSLTLFLLASVLVSIAVVPILVTAARAPDFSEPERISLRRAYEISPLAMVGMLMQGMSAAMLFGMGPVYGNRIGLSAAEVSLFIAATNIGVLLLQYPLGRLSDRLDRRIVIGATAGLAGIVACLAAFVSASDFWLLILVIIAYGGLNLTCYSLFLAHANDYLTPSQMVSTASALIMVNGMGAVVGSPLVAGMMDIFGNVAYFLMLGLSNFIVFGFALIRMMMRAPVPAEAQGPFVAMPEAGTATAVALNPEAAWEEESGSPEAEPDPLEDNPYFPTTPSSS